ncbi:MAG: YaaL family protein [Oscillospiraceae bacterium]|nr:YaaL family protein [Oscillospiraceae bacterium]
MRVRLTGSLLKPKRDRSTREQEKQEQWEVLEAMRRTRQELCQARLNFNDARAPELVEASVYEINALQARYAYYLRLAREMRCEEPQGLVFRSVRRPVS